MARIIVDWGSSNFRAALLDTSGKVIAKKSSSRGIFDFGGEGFAEYLFDVCRDWLSQASEIRLCGMIGSKNGWIETPYLSCPVDRGSLADSLVAVKNRRGLDIAIVPGVSFCGDLVEDKPAGLDRADVMRGEETQVIGFIQSTATNDALVCLPGTHSKWVSVKNSAIDRFTTFMTGELFELLSHHSSLAGLCQTEVFDEKVFIEGVAYAQSKGTILSQLFTIRAWCMTGMLQQQHSRSFLSGLLIGAELSEALSQHPCSELSLIGNADLTGRYQQACRQFSIPCCRYDATIMTIEGLSALNQEKSLC